MQAKPHKHAAQGQFLAACRKSCGLTQRDVAEALGVTVGSVQRWETGECRPKQSTRADLATLLELSVRDFIMAGFAQFR